MIKYSVRYELKTNFSNVIIEIKCKDKEEAEKVLEERKSTYYLHNVKLLEE